MKWGIKRKFTSLRGKYSGYYFKVAQRFAWLPTRVESMSGNYMCYIWLEVYYVKKRLTLNKWVTAIKYVL